jgi:hypothetical protein
MNNILYTVLRVNIRIMITITYNKNLSCIYYKPNVFRPSECHHQRYHPIDMLQSKLLRVTVNSYSTRISLTLGSLLELLFCCKAIMCWLLPPPILQCHQAHHMRPSHWQWQKVEVQNTVFWLGQVEHTVFVCAQHVKMLNWLFEVYKSADFLLHSDSHIATYKYCFSSMICNRPQLNLIFMSVVNALGPSNVGKFVSTMDCTGGFIVH